MSELVAASTSAWAPLHHRVFRWLWLAQLGSNVGVWMQTVGAQWFLVEQAHSSALVAWVQTASLMPTLLLSLVAGVLADSYDRRLLLIITNGAATVLAGVLAGLSYAGALTPWGLLALTFLIGSASALTAPAWQAIQPELVAREELSSASALGSVTVNAARAVGPAIAGVLVAATGPALVFLLNAASFVLVIVALVAAAFVSAMHLVEQTQRRTGATSWRLYRGGERAEEFREEFTVRSWSEFQAQSRERWTGYDRDRFVDATALAAAPPTEEHFFGV